MLYVNEGYRIGGTLTTGTAQQCGAGATLNRDYFSSFRTFFSSISPAYLSGANADNTYQPAQTSTTPTGTTCFTAAATTSEHGPFSGLGGDAMTFASIVVVLLLAGVGRLRRNVVIAP